MVNYQGRIIIIGLGLTGLSCINFFLTRGITPYVMDINARLINIDQLSKKIKYYYVGGIKDSWLLSADLIVVSPGIPLTHPSLKAAIHAGIEVIGDIELFCREARAPIIAITGSNGKSTVATLVNEMAKAAGINVGIGGNIGFPVLTLLNPAYELYILELSSFQLETTNSLQACVSTVLNIAEDHMDRYPYGLQQYRAAKLRIHKNAKICVINTDDILTVPIYNVNKHFVSFGINIGDYHLNNEYGETWLYANGKNILNIKEISLYGQHNYINGLAALALADIIGLPRSSSLKVLTSFTGLKHRFQLVLKRNNICWINDSKATNVSSTKAALKSLHDIEGTLHLLLGGDGKSADFSPLKPLVANNKVQLYCFGSDRKKLAMLHSTTAKQTKTLKQAMHLLAHNVKPGDTVLLSPACSSLDQFKNFEQRGTIFTNLAMELSL